MTLNNHNVVLGTIQSNDERAVSPFRCMSLNTVPRLRVPAVAAVLGFTHTNSTASPFDI